MLEAMQEQRVTVVGKTFTLESPFMVLATQTRSNKKVRILFPRHSWIDSCL